MIPQTHLNPQIDQSVDETRIQSILTLLMGSMLGQLRTHCSCEFTISSLSRTGNSNEMLLREASVDGWMNGVLGHFFALSRLNWAGDNLD